MTKIEGDIPCDDGGKVTPGALLSDIRDGAIASGAAVTYDSSVTDLAEAKAETDFGYYYDWEVMDGSIVSLNNYLNSSSVKISGSKLTINLGVPKDTVMDDLANWGLTLSDNNAKVFYLPQKDGKLFMTSAANGKYTLRYDNENNFVTFIYADRDVTMTGTSWASFNCSLKKGWNCMIYSENASGETATSSTVLPSGFKWTVYQN